jgi:hypothetical protein
VQLPHNAVPIEPNVIQGELVELAAIGHAAPYTSHELAASLGIADSTLRTRWLPWLQKATPVELLVNEQGYTELAWSLLQDFAQIPSKKGDRQRWVQAAKDRYRSELLPGGVMPAGVPDELGGALALLLDQGGKLQSSVDLELADIQALIQSQANVEAEFDQAEIAAMRAVGTNRGVTRFKIEAQAEDVVYYQLRKAKAEARTSPNVSP